jgi:hypothetical protein
VASTTAVRLLCISFTKLSYSILYQHPIGYLFSQSHTETVGVQLSWRKLAANS